MIHERDIFNGHVYSIDPYEEPSTEAPGITPYPGWARALIWLGLGFAGLYLFWLPMYQAARVWWAGV